jgi:hypothetical protein
MSLFVAAFRQFDVYFDVIQSKVIYKENCEHHPIMQKYSDKCVDFVDGIRNNTKGVALLERISTFSPYAPFPNELFRSRMCQQYRQILLYSSSFNSKDDAIGEICAQMSNRHIYHEDMDNHYIMTCDEFDQYMFVFARKQVGNFQKELENKIHLCKILIKKVIYRK